MIFGNIVVLVVKARMKLVNSLSKSVVTSSLLEVRAWEKKNLPSPQSYLAYEIFLLVCHSTLEGQPFTLNQLFHTISYSETAIRRQLSTLIEDKWFVLIGGQNDKRLKLVVAEEKSLKLIEQYACVLANSLALRVIAFNVSSVNK